VDQALALFGRPSTVTGFYQCQHGDSKEDDNFTLILRYDTEEYKKLTVTVKSSSVNTMRVPFKYFARGTTGTFIKFGEDPQEPQVAQGLNPASPGWGEEPENTYGTLTTTTPFHPGQKKVTALSWVKQDVYEGKFPSLKGDYSDYYADVVNAVRGGETVVTAQHARDGLRIIELGRQSADEGRTCKMD
jgi:predicted dehydrogenase